MERGCVLMAYDKVVDSQALDSGLGAVADAIRAQTGGTAKLTLSQMPAAISSIQTGGAVLPELENPGGAEDLMAGKQLLDGAGAKITGTFTLDDELAEQAELINQINTVLAGKAVGSSGKPEQEKNIEITTNGTYEIAPDDGYALSRVTVTANVAGGDPELPPGWWRCDYILFTGEQTVDTGLKCTHNTRLRIDYTREKSSQHYLFGHASKNNDASCTGYQGGSWRFGNKAVTKTVVTRPDMVYSAIMDRTEITVTGSTQSISGVSEFETVGTLTIGSCRNTDGSLGAPQYEGKVELVQMWESGEPTLNWLPITNGTAYRFWDAAGKKFHDSITDTPLSGGYW